MPSSSPRIVGFTINGGTPGSTVLTSVVGTSLATVTAIRFSGTGVVAHFQQPAYDDRINMVVMVSGEAVPGPRAIALDTVDGAWVNLSAPLFFVLSPSGYMSSNGIGSHLI
jgi:hypothetical protein